MCIFFKGTRVPLTNIDEIGFYSADFSGDCSFYVLNKLGPEVPTQSVHSTDGSITYMLEGMSPLPPPSPSPRPRAPSRACHPLGPVDPFLSFLPETLLFLSLLYCCSRVFFFKDNKALSDLLSQYTLPKRDFFVTDEGINGCVVRVSSDHVPVLFSVYGGPGSQGTSPPLPAPS